MRPAPTGLAIEQGDIHVDQVVILLPNRSVVPADARQAPIAPDHAGDRVHDKRILFVLPTLDLLIEVQGQVVVASG